MTPVMSGVSIAQQNYNSSCYCCEYCYDLTGHGVQSIFLRCSHFPIKFCKFLSFFDKEDR